jgi:gas vesicle protein GvpN
VSLVHGSDEFSASDLVGRDSGYRKSSMVDNYISSVLKTEETMQVNWVDNRLTTACERGHTLIYDEFNRSRAEANNTLLSILEEGILNVPRSDGSGYIVVHPEFRLILTSNPVEYAGVHETQDALLDRLVTIEVGHYDRDTEVAITASKSGIAEDDAARLVDVARLLRSRDPGGHVPTVRSTITLAQVLARAEVPVDPSDERFLAFAWDMFGRAIRRTAADRTDLGRHVVAELMRSVPGRGAGGRRGGGDAGRVKGTGGTTRGSRRTTKEGSS